MSFQILTTDQIDPSVTTKRAAWVVYSPSKGFFVDYDESSEELHFSKILQDSFIFDDIEAVKQFVETLFSELDDHGYLELKCSL